MACGCYFWSLETVTRFLVETDFAKVGPLASTIKQFCNECLAVVTRSVIQGSHSHGKAWKKSCHGKWAEKNMEIKQIS